MNKSTYKKKFPLAERKIRELGERVTLARVCVLSYLLTTKTAQTHLEIEHALSDENDIDRVTIYRVLEWLTTVKLVHKISGEDRIWRFSIEPEFHDRHAHFNCTDCGKVYCLEQLMPRKINLPPGYKSQQLDLTIKGLCAHCSA